MRPQQIQLQLTDLFRCDPHVAQLTYAGIHCVGHAIPGEQVFHNRPCPFDGLTRKALQQHRALFVYNRAEFFEVEVVSVDSDRLHRDHVFVGVLPRNLYQAALAASGKRVSVSGEAYRRLIGAGKSGHQYRSRGDVTQLPITNRPYSPTAPLNTLRYFSGSERLLKVESVTICVVSPSASSVWSLARRISYPN